jgi:hypothetical protein
MKGVVRSSLLALMLSVAAADIGLADETFILATGRRDPRIYAIDFNAALKSRSPSPNGTVNLSGRASRMQATGSGHWGLLPTRATDFGPDPEFLGPGSSMLGGGDMIAAEVEEVIDLIVG